MERPKIKKVHHPVRLTRSLIRLGGHVPGVAAVLEDDDGTLWRLLQLMNGERTRHQIVSALLDERPDVDADSVVEAVGALVASGFAEDAAGPTPAMLSPAEVDRYQRAADFFAWIDTAPRASRYELQARLKRSRVTVCGLGGSGSAVAAALVGAGVGSIHCVDHDRIEAANLTRQLLYSEADVGQSKVATAVGRLRALNPYVKVTGKNLRVTCIGDLVLLMHDCDLFILCADEPRGLINSWTNAAALDTRTPWQLAVYTGPMLVTGLFVPGATACYACIPKSTDVDIRQHGAPPLETIYDWPGHAVLAPTANLTGHAAALEAIYFLTGLRVASLGRIFQLSFVDLAERAFVEADAGSLCDACGRPAGRG